MIYDIFKVGVYRTNLNLDIDAIFNYSNNLEKIYKESCANKSNRGGFQTPNLPTGFDSPIIKSNRGGFHSENLEESDDDSNQLLKTLVQNISYHVNVYGKELGYNNLKLDNIWCNINYYKDYNEIHNHPGGKVSGVYYVKAPKNCGHITFYSPSFREVTQAKLAVNDNHYSSQTWWLPAVENHLYLFPSYITHSVNPNMCEDEARISYSFNYW